MKQVTLLSFWVISPSGSELPARQLHTCRKWTTPNQPSWGFFGAWAGLSIVISNGILGRAGVQEIKFTLLSLHCCSESGPVIRPALSLPELTFLQCNAFQTLSAKCFEEDKNRAVTAPGSWMIWSFLNLKGSLVSKVLFV